MKTIQEILDSCKSATRLSDPIEIEKHLAKKSAARSKDPSYNFVRSKEDCSFHLEKVLGSMDFTKNFSVDELKAIAQRRNIPWDEAYAERFLASYGSDERVDSHGDIVLQDWDFSKFEKNPAMPFNHQWDGMPLGAHVDWKVVTRSDDDYSGPALWLLSLHATAEQLPFADFVYRMRKANFLRANSVGFYPGIIIDINDEEERARLGLGRWGDILAENVLLENSPTLLGANHGALTILNSARDEGLFNKSDIIGLRELNRVSLQAEPDKWRIEDKRYRQIAQVLFPSSECDEHKDVEQPFEVDKFLESSEDHKKIFVLSESSSDDEHKETEIVDPEVTTNTPDDSVEGKTFETTQVLQRLVQIGAALESVTLALLSRFDALEEQLTRMEASGSAFGKSTPPTEVPDQFSAFDSFVRSADSNSTNPE